MNSSSVHFGYGLRSNTTSNYLRLPDRDITHKSAVPVDRQAIPKLNTPYSNTTHHTKQTTSPRTHS